MSPLVRIVRAVNRMWLAYRLGGQVDMGAEERAAMQRLFARYPRYRRLIQLLLPMSIRFDDEGREIR